MQKEVPKTTEDKYSKKNLAQNSSNTTLRTKFEQFLAFKGFFAFLQFLMHGLSNIFNTLKRASAYLIAVIRAIILLITLGAYLLIYIVGSLFTAEEKLLNHLKRSWCKMALKVLGLKVILDDEYQDYDYFMNSNTFLAVSNHRSFIDPVIVLAYLNVRPLAKAEIADYPLIGYAAKKVGVVFVERHSKNSKSEAISAIKTYLTSKKSVLVFPEGTTSDADTTIEFKKGSFIAASESKCPILPLTIHYKNQYANWTTGSMITQYFRHFSHLTSVVHFKIGDLHKIPPSEGDIQSIRDDINENIKQFKTAHYC